LRTSNSPTLRSVSLTAWSSVGIRSRGVEKRVKRG
jgi:hypothetical protein